MGRLLTITNPKPYCRLKPSKFLQRLQTLIARSKQLWS